MDPSIKPKEEQQYDEQKQKSPQESQKVTFTAYRKGNSRLNTRTEKKLQEDSKLVLAKANAK